MKVYKGNYKNIKNDIPMAVAIGNFDGVHLGHQALINKLFTLDDDLMKAVITFHPHTMQLFTKNLFQTISTVADKEDFFRNLNLDQAYFIEFDNEFSNLLVPQMIDFLQKINVKTIIVGSDFKFGQKGVGRPNDLSKDFEVIVVDDIIDGNQRISSTLIKDLITNGDLENVKRLLNHSYQVTCIVITGNQIGGSVLGFPTANLDYNNLVLPPNGVYYVKVKYNNQTYDGMANIGNNPTVNFSSTKRMEVHILDFDKSIYHETLKIEFIKWLRSEKKFNSKDELIKQLKQDRNFVKQLSKN